MSDCKRFEAMLESEIAGDVHLADSDALRAHAESCAACGALLKLHDDLVRLGSAVVEPSEAELERATAGLARSTSAASVVRFRKPAANPWLLGLAAAAAGGLLFAAGLAAGRSRGERAGDVALGATPRLLNAMNAEAASNRELSDVENSHFTYSNVALRHADAGRVALDFDVTQHVRVVEPVDSKLVQEVIVHALLDRSNTGSRLRALSYAETLEPKVKEALVLSLENDPSLAVRLKALELLGAHMDQPDVEAAVLATLREDDSVQMRLEALDALAASRMDPDKIRGVIHAAGRPDDEALLVHLASLPNRL